MVHSDSPRNALIVLGVGALVYLSAKVLRTLVLWSQLALGPVNVKGFKGDWAVVTGASEGVGEALAHSVASHGMNVVMLDRSAEKLSVASTKLHAAHPDVETRTIAQDMTVNGAVHTVCKQLDGLTVSLLVCNTTDTSTLLQPRPFWHYTPAEIEHMRRQHGEATYGLVSGLLARMIDRGKGAVVAVSSSAAKAPAYRVPYGAEHAKVVAFMEGLAGELQGTGVTAQAAVLDFDLLHTHEHSLLASNAVPSPPPQAPEAANVAHALVRHIGKGDATFTPLAGRTLRLWLRASLLPGGLEGWLHGRAKKQYTAAATSQLVSDVSLA